MAVDRQWRRYILQPGHSVRHIQGIQFALSGPIPEREKKFHFRTILHWTAEPEMPSHTLTGAKDSRNDPRILKVVVPLRRQMGGVGPFAGGGKPWGELFASQCGGRESHPRHGSPVFSARSTAACILLHRAAATPSLGAIFISVRMAAISSWYCFMRRSKVRRSFVQTSV